MVVVVMPPHTQHSATASGPVRAITSDSAETVCLLHGACPATATERNKSAVLMKWNFKKMYIQKKKGANTNSRRCNAG